MSRHFLTAFLLALLLFTPARGDDEEDTSDTTSPEAAAARLLDSNNHKTTFAELFGDGYKVVLFTKPWSDTNGQLIGELSHFHLRLNRGGLKSGVIFLRTDLSDATRVMKEYGNRVRYAIDPDGTLARLLAVRTCPALALVDPEGRVKFSTPLLAQELVKQVAAHYNKPDALFASPRPGPPRRPGIPKALGNTGRFSIQ